MITPEQIAEGRRLLEAWRASESTGFLSERLSAMEMIWWLADNANALLDAAERAEAAERERDEARIELRRMQAGELPGGWTEELNAAIEARHRAERELAEAREDSARLDWLDARQPTFAVGRGPSGEWAVFGPTNIGGCGYSDVRAAIDAEREKR